MSKLLPAAAIVLTAFWANSYTAAMGSGKPESDDAICTQMRKTVKEGDLIFIEVDNAIFQRVARAQGGWASHVGIVLWDEKTGQLAVHESTIPKVVVTNLCKFLHHGAKDRFLVRRYKTALRPRDLNVMNQRSKELQGTLYHLGFKYDSKRQFCSKFVHELYAKALGIDAGRFETFGDLMENIKGTKYEQQDMAFWRAWFLGHIPLKRRTVTPQSQLEDPNFNDVYYNPPKGDDEGQLAQPEEPGRANTKASDLEIEEREL